MSKSSVRLQLYKYKYIAERFMGFKYIPTSNSMRYCDALKGSSKTTKREMLINCYKQKVNVNFRSKRKDRKVILRIKGI